MKGNSGPKVRRPIPIAIERARFEVLLETIGKKYDVDPAIFMAKLNNNSEILHSTGRKSMDYTVLLTGMAFTYVCSHAPTLASMFGLTRGGLMYRLGRFRHNMKTPWFGEDVEALRKMLLTALKERALYSVYMDGYEPSRMGERWWTGIERRGLGEEIRKKRYVPEERYVVDDTMPVPMSRIRTLCAATLVRAIQDRGGVGIRNTNSGALAHTKRVKAIKDEVIKWFEEDAPDRPFSFKWICMVLDMDPEYAKQGKAISMRGRGFKSSEGFSDRSCGFEDVYNIPCYKENVWQTQLRYL